jgi:2-polyprenyl-6-methoxyphenol hydroxylase-like FAD-dependent oxidoreductase
MSDQHDVDVAIVGAGPTGLLLSAELALRGVRVAVLERHAARPDFVRAFNLGPRSLELLDRRGIVERFLAEGPRVSATSFAGLDVPLDLTCLETDHPYMLGIPQTRTEALLEDYAQELGVVIRRGQEVVDVTQHDERVTVDVNVAAGARGPSSKQLRLSARYLVGCDGGRSVIRKRSGIAFPGTEATHWALLGDVELEDPASLSYGIHQTPRGTVYVIPRPGYVRICTGERTRPAERDAVVSLDELRDAVHHVLGRDVALVRPRWLTRFGDAARVAEQFRVGRVLLAGDAAHVHPPAGAQGINVGLQDAFNLGWKLAAVLRGWAPDGLLDSYHTERHAAAERVLMHTRAQTELGRTDERIAPVRALLQSITRGDEARRALTELVTGFDTRYSADPSDHAESGRAWLGKLAPNVSFVADGARSSIAERMRGGRALLFTRGADEDLQAAVRERSDRVEHVGLDLNEPASGWLAGVERALVRPDGHIAWLSTSRERDDPGLNVAMRRWIGGEVAVA